MASIQNGDQVQVHYTGTLEDGTVFDSSEGREPLAFTAGSEDLIAGFSQGVLGMDEGDKKTLTIEAKDAYGERQDELVQEVPRANLPEDVEVGSILAPTEAPEMQVVITALDENSATVDANHPLAGKTLVFDVEVVSITPAAG